MSAQSDPAGFTTVIDVPPSTIGDESGIGSDTQLNVADGGTVGIRFNAGAADGSSTNVEVNISGGLIGRRIEAFAGSEINISGGEVGADFDAFDGSVVNISGGFVGARFNALAGSTVSISGGFVDSFFDAFSGSTVNISGGEIGRSFIARTGSSVVVSGGRLGSPLFASSGDFTLVGGEFQINGAAPLDPVSVTLSDSDFLTGTLEDGSSFIFSPTIGDSISNVTLSSGTLPAIDLTPVLIADVDDVAPNSLRTGQSLTLQGTGMLPADFTAVGADLTIEGGTGNGWDVANSTIDIAAGEFGGGNLFGSTLNLEGGGVVFLGVLSGTTVNQSGGTLGFARLGENGTFNLSGGTFGDGSFRASVLAEAGSTLNLFASEASIDGVAIDLSAGDTLEITQRGFDTVLSGLLSDGAEFSFLLRPIPEIPALGGDAFATGSTVTVTLVPAVPEIILGDVNQDDVVNFEDISPFVEVLMAGNFLAQADINQDGEVDFLDIGPFVGILTNQ